MSKPIAILAALLLAAGITAGYLWQQLRAERQLSAQWQQHATKMQEQTTQLEQQLRRATAPAALPPPGLPPQAAASGAATIAVAAPNATQAGRVPPVIDTAAMNKALLAAMYPDIEKVLGLTPEETEALAQLLRQNATDAQIEAMLGAKAVQWPEYKVSLEARRRTSELQAMLARSSHPLSEQQVQQLVPTIVAEQKRTTEEAVARGPRPSDPRAQLDFDEESLKATEARYRRIIAAARNFMSSEQVALMQSSQQRLLATQRANLQVQRAQVEAGGNAAATMSPQYMVPVEVSGQPVVIVPRN